MMQDMALFERSIGRSVARRRVLMMLSSLGEAFPRQLARACGLEAGRLRMVMFGREPAYSAALALVPLGLAEVSMTRLGRVYRITPRGRRKARQLAARWARRAEARAGRLQRTAALDERAALLAEGK